MIKCLNLKYFIEAYSLITTIHNVESSKNLLLRRKQGW